MSGQNLFPTREWMCQVCGNLNGRDMTAPPANCMWCGLTFGARAYPAYDLKTGKVVHAPPAVAESAETPDEWCRYCAGRGTINGIEWLGDGYEQLRCPTCMTEEAILRRRVARLTAENAALLSESNHAQDRVDALEDWQRDVCNLLTCPGDEGPLPPEHAESRINELLRIERTAPQKVVVAAYRASARSPGAP